QALVQGGGSSDFIGFLNFSAKEGEGISFTSGYTSTSASNADTLALTGTAAWIYWAAEILGIALVAAFQARKGAKVPFCNTHNRFLTSVNLGRVPRESADQFMAHAKANNWSGTAALISPAGTRISYPYLAVVAQKCPDCNSNNVPLKVVRKISSRSNSDRIVYKATLTPAQYGDLSGAPQNPM
ncbi:MAG TPA: hypothetical protein VKQ72_14345, partial [Aggregatilineales bacterium]|nr:hypothetical protein [Aggregatilineales bacterium]